MERRFAELTNKQIPRGVHRSVSDLERAIGEFIDVHNKKRKPFVWTKSVDEILSSIARFAQRTMDVHQAQQYIARINVTGHQHNPKLKAPHPNPEIGRDIPDRI